MTRHDAPRWALATLPLAPLASVVYFVAEWLFFVTKPSAVGSLPFATQLLVLLKSPLAIVFPLLCVQVGASVLSLVAYPRIRGAALIPAGAVCGLLLFVLTDNFTYTVFGFSVLSVSAPVRLIYAALLPSLMACAGWTLSAWMGRAVARRGVIWLASVLASVFAIAPMADIRIAQAAPDLNAPPALPASRPGMSPRPNILLLGIDGVDASKLSAYGYERQTSPFLETVREQSLFFENAFANVGRTHGSLVSLLTGRLPLTTHVTFPPTILQGEDAHRHLPALLKRLGYTTLQLGMRHYADAEDANLLGFDAANYRWQQLEDVQSGGGATQETDVFRAAVAERLDERLALLFGFRHAIDGFAHVEGKQESPYWTDERRVATLIRYFSIAAGPWFVHAHLLDTHCCAFHPGRMYFSNGPDPSEDVHDSQLREADGHVREVFEALAVDGRLDQTLVVIYSDHTLRWTTKGRVPLMIRFPGARVKGRMAANVQLADVAPTILAYLGLDIPGWMDGRSLLDPDKLPSGRPIFGLSDIAERQTIASFLSSLSTADPPNYGAASATLIAGNQWFELSLLDGSLHAGPVLGHSVPGLRPMPESVGLAMLTSRLVSAGFSVPHGDGLPEKPLD